MSPIDRSNIGWRAGLFAVCALLTVAAAAGAADKRLGRLLGQKVSPGSIALLAEWAGEEKVLGRWREGLEHSEPGVRAATARVLLATGSVALVDDLRSALVRESDSEAGREALRALRALGGEAEVEAVRSASAEVAARLDAWRAKLVPDVTGRRRRQPERVLELTVDGEKIERKASELPGLSVASGYPRGLIEDVLRVSRCRPKADKRYAGAEVSGFDAAGRGMAVELVTWPVGARCREAVAALFFLLVDDRGAAAPAGAHILFLDEALGPCLAEPGAADVEGASAVSALHVGGDVTPPEILHQVKPRYPQAAKDARIQGIVIVEAFITAGGCVGDLKVLRGHPELSSSAMLAVSQWRFEPGRLKGEAVPVYFTLTVNFTLR